jgi:hypothetical protein
MKRGFIPTPYRYRKSRRVDPLDWFLIALALFALAIVGASFVLSVREAL